MFFKKGVIEGVLLFLRFGEVVKNSKPPNYNEGNDEYSGGQRWLFPLSVSGFLLSLLTWWGC